MPKSKLMVLPLGLRCSMTLTLSTTPPLAAMIWNSLVSVKVPPLPAGKVPPNQSAPTTR